MSCFIYIPRLKVSEKYRASGYACAGLWGVRVEVREGGGYPKESYYKQREMWESHKLLSFCV